MKSVQYSTEPYRTWHACPVVHAERRVPRCGNPTSRRDTLYGTILPHSPPHLMNDDLIIYLYCRNYNSHLVDCGTQTCTDCQVCTCLAEYNTEQGPGSCARAPAAKRAAARTPSTYSTVQCCTAPQLGPLAHTVQYSAVPLLVYSSALSCCIIGLQGTVLYCTV